MRKVTPSRCPPQLWHPNSTRKPEISLPFGAPPLARAFAGPTVPLLFFASRLDGAGTYRRACRPSRGTLAPYLLTYDPPADFLTRWQASGGAERANCALFLNDLAALLGVAPPDVVTDDPTRDAYVLEKPVMFEEGGGKAPR